MTVFYGANRILTLPYTRSRETAADEQVPNTRGHLEGAITTCRERLDQELCDINNGSCPNIDGNIIAYLWHAAHPTTRWRLNRFKERLASLDYAPQAKEK